MFDEVLRCPEVYYLLLKFIHIPPKEESIIFATVVVARCVHVHSPWLRNWCFPIAPAFVPQLVCLLPFFSPALLRLPGGSKYKHVRPGPPSVFGALSFAVPLR